MPQPFKQWKVLPHGKLSYIDENLLTVVGAIKNKPALREQLEDWARLYSLKRIIVSHGDIIIEANPTDVLRDLAKQLAA
jgi:hypothetical protein